MNKKIIKDKEKSKKYTKYSQEVANHICFAIATSNKGIKALHRENPKLYPSHDSIFSWIKTYPEFKKQYNLARRHQALVLADEIIEIADDNSKDTYVNDKGKSCVDYENIQRSTLRVNTRKWVLSKILPRKYGEKVAQEITGKGGKAIEMQHSGFVVVVPAEKTIEEWCDENSNKES